MEDNKDKPLAIVVTTHNKKNANVVVENFL